MGTPSGSYTDLAQLIEAATAGDASPGFVDATRSSLISFSTQQLQPPSNLYIKVSDKIFVEVVNSNPQLTQLSVICRLLTPDGNITRPVLVVNNIPSTRNAAQVSFQLAEGYILSVGLDAAGVLLQRGATYVRVSLVPGGSPVSNRCPVLIADYFSDLSVPSFPQGRLRDSLEGQGNIRSVQIANPAAGVDWQAAVPQFTRWRVYSATATFNTSATVANRQINFIVFDPSGNQIYTNQPAYTQPASTGANYVFATGVPNSPALGVQNIVCAPSKLVLPQAFVVRPVTVSLQAADQWSAISLLVEEWMETFG